MEKLLFNLHISSIEIGFPQFCMGEISVQIPEFVDRETNVHRKCSTFLHGSTIFHSIFWPYFRRYRDDKFVDRSMNVWKKFLFKFQNSWIGRQMFVKIVPQFCVEPKIFPAIFGHISVVIGTIILSIEQRNVENKLQKINFKATV